MVYESTNLFWFKVGTLLLLVMAELRRCLEKASTDDAALCVYRV